MSMPLYGLYDDPDEYSYRVCYGCGSVVADKERHDEWHELMGQK